MPPTCRTTYAQSVAWDAQHQSLVAVETTPLRATSTAHAPITSSQALPAPAQAVVQAGPAVVILLVPTATKVLPHTVEPLQLGWGLLASEAPYLWLHSPLVQDAELGPGGAGALGGAPSKTMLSLYKGVKTTALHCSPWSICRAGQRGRPVVCPAAAAELPLAQRGGAQGRGGRPATARPAVAVARISQAVRAQQPARHCRGVCVHRFCIDSCIDSHAPQFCLAKMGTVPAATTLRSLEAVPEPSARLGIIAAQYGMQEEAISLLNESKRFDLLTHVLQV